MKTPLLSLAACMGGLLCSDSFASDYRFVHEKHPWHITGNYAQVAGAEVTTHPAKGSHLHYGEGYGNLFYSHFLNTENSLTAQVGVNYTRIHWEENPRFTDDNYTYGLLSLAWISHSLEKWRWVMTGGTIVDTRTWNFGQSAVYYGMLWGRNQYSESVGLHIGFYGYYGAMNGYFLPILGFDWKCNRKWELKAVFPLDASLNYNFSKNWFTSIAVMSFGGPYRFPRRIHGGVGRYENGIFEVYSTGVEWEVKFDKNNFIIFGIGAGWNFGGWLLIKDSHNHHPKYYHFDSAPYGRAFFGLSF